MFKWTYIEQNAVMKMNKMAGLDILHYLLNSLKNHTGGSKTQFGGGNYPTG